jgi:DNA-binding SARP family transcriptional activator/Tfp pilus assembly protein PilF
MAERTGKVAPKVLGAAERSKVVPLDRGRAPDLAARQGPRQPIVRIHLLGTLRATTYLGESILPRGKKARAILGHLCLNAGEPVSRSRLASLLWDRVPDHQARNSLRQALWELSAAMGSLANELICVDRDTVRLEAGPCWIDAIAVLSPEPPPPHSFRGDLAALCTGGLLEELDGLSVSFDHWLLAERTRFDARLRSLLEGELQGLERSNANAERRAAMARRVVAFDPTHEGASRILMRALADLGERPQALREYERCRDALRAKLDVEPSAETRALHQAIKTFGRTETRSEGPSAAAPSREESAKALVSSGTCSRLRVGVLPLRASGALAEERLAFSLGQEIAAALARFRWFDVIAPMTLARTPSASETRDLLGRKQLHYIVDGDLSGNEKKFQISIRLLDVAQDARPVWSDRFDLAVDALDQVNELITAPVVARIDPVILFIEGQQKRPQRSGVTGLVLQAIPLLYSMERKKYEEAGQLIRQALEMDPENAMAAAWGAHWQLFYVGQGWSSDPGRSVETAQELAIRALRIDPENAEAMGIYGHICAFLQKDFDSALYYFDRALRLNPNLAFVWALSAATYAYIGEPDIALQRLDRCRDLAPFDPYFCLWECAYAIAHVFNGDYEKAVVVGRRAVKANPHFSNAYKPVIASLGHLGRRDEAAQYLDRLLSLEPNFSVQHFGKVYPFGKAEDRERYMQGLRLAGVPEA